MEYPDLVPSLQQAQSGDFQAEEVLFSELRVRFRTLATRYVGEEMAEDIAHDACVIVLSKYRDLSSQIPFEQWAYRVLRNVINNYMRTKATRQRYLDYSVDPEGVTSSQLSASHRDESAELFHCLRKIAQASPRHADALALAVEGYSSDEICAKLNVSRTNLYVLLHRARRWLTDCLKEKGMR